MKSWNRVFILIMRSFILSQPVSALTPGRKETGTRITEMQFVPIATTIKRAHVAIALRFFYDRD